MPGFQKYHSRTLWRRAVDRPRFGAGSNVGSNVGLLVQAACSLMSAFELRSGHKLLGWAGWRGWLAGLAGPFGVHVGVHFEVHFGVQLGEATFCTRPW